MYVRIYLDLSGELVERFDIGRLGLLQYLNHLQYSRLAQLLRETRVVHTACSPEVNLLQRAGAVGGIERFLTGEEFLDLAGPVDDHHCT